LNSGLVHQPSFGASSFVPSHPTLTRPSVRASPSLPGALNTSCNHFYEKTASKIDAYIASQIQPDGAFLASCSSGMDRLVTHLQHNVPGLLRPSRVIKVRTIYGLIINTLLLNINKLKAVRHDATVECFSLVV